MLKTKWLDDEAAHPQVAPRNFDISVGGQIGLWHETIERQFGGVAPEARLVGGVAPEALLETIVAHMSRVAGPLALVAALAGLICWL